MNNVKLFYQHVLLNLVVVVLIMVNAMMHQIYRDVIKINMEINVIGQDLNVY